MTPQEQTIKVYEQVFQLLDFWTSDFTQEKLEGYDAVMREVSQSEDVVNVVAGVCSAGIALGAAIAQMKGVHVRDYLMSLQEEWPRAAHNVTNPKISDMILAGVALVTGGYHYGSGAISQEDYDLLIKSYGQDIGGANLVNAVVSVCASFITIINSLHGGDPTAGRAVYGQFKEQVRKQLAEDGLSED